MRLKQAFVIALASVILGCSTVPVKPQKPVEEIVAEHSMKSTDLTGLVYKISKEEGIKQLSELAMNNKHEDIWFYIPENVEWIDYGEDVSINGCTPRFKILPELRPDVKEVSNYHIHPAYNLRMGGFSKSEYKNFYGALPPSLEDLEYWLKEKAELGKSGVNVKESTVVDLGGYWVLNFETTDIDKMKNNLENYGYLVDAHTTKYYSAYKSNKNDIARQGVLKLELIKDFEKKSVELGLDLKYSFL